MADTTFMSMCSPSEPCCEITVKNTFLHLTESRLARRRSSSVPCSARLSPCASKAPYALDDISTASETPDTDHESVDSSNPADGPEPESPSGDAGGAKRTPLSSFARPWMPNDATTTMMTQPMVSPMNHNCMMQIGSFLCQVTTVVGAAVSALASFGYVYNVAAVDGPLGWCISAQMLAKDARAHREKALTLVKNGLLQAAATSENVFIAGYLSQPFTITPMGFVAEVVMAPHASEACWSMLKRGFCHRGAQCRWKHPEQQRTVNVVIQVDDV